MSLPRASTAKITPLYPTHYSRPLHPTPDDCDHAGEVGRGDPQGHGRRPAGPDSAAPHHRRGAPPPRGQGRGHREPGGPHPAAGGEYPDHDQDRGTLSHPAQLRGCGALPPCQSLPGTVLL